MRAFVFDHAELLSMDEHTLDFLIKLLTPELIIKLDKVFSSKEFRMYRKNEMLADSVKNLNKKLGRFIRPVAFAEKLKTKPFPDSDMSYFQAFNSEFNVLFDKISLFGMSMENLEEIEKTLGDFIKIIPLLPTHYKAGRKADYEEFVKSVKERVVPLSLSLHYKTGIPYNKNLIKELKNNKSVLYDKNAVTRSSGYGYIAGKSDILSIIHEGYKWNIYCRKNNISDEAKYAYIL